MTMPQDNESDRSGELPFFAQPRVGSALTILAGLTFYFLLMILPLVGPAAMRGSGSPGAGPAPHLARNIAAFVSVLLLCFSLSLLALRSKLARRKMDGSPLPYYSIGLCAACVFLLVVLVTGLLQI